MRNTLTKLNILHWVESMILLGTCDMKFYIIVLFVTLR